MNTKGWNILLSLLFCGCSVLSDIDEFSFDKDVNGSDSDKNTDSSTSQDTDSLLDSDSDTDTVLITETDSTEDTFGGDSESDSEKDTDSGKDTGPEPQKGPCGIVTCQEGEPNRCGEKGELLVTGSPGVCVDDTCVYGHLPETCAGGACQDGLCVDSQCQGISCHTPPERTCADSDGSIIRYEPSGSCSMASGTPECHYNSAELSCFEGCRDGVCADSGCWFIECTQPPASYCEGDFLVTFNRDVRCQEGRCLYRPIEIPCGGSCIAGQCQPMPCLGVKCQTPPASYCLDDNTRRIFAVRGQCESGQCRYLYNDIICDQGCAEGQCKGDSCSGNGCDVGPSPFCKDSSVMMMWDSNSGFCVDGICNFGFYEIECESECIDGLCRPVEHKYVDVVGGSFQMGSAADEGGEPSEMPVHTVDIPSFQMLSSEVTVSEYQLCVLAGGCEIPVECSENSTYHSGGSSSSNAPLNCVNWLEARNFCAWVGARLPSESEWEYVARSQGHKEYNYPWGQVTDPAAEVSCQYATMHEDGADGCGIGTPDSVCSRNPGNTEQGFCDMSGNVGEWVADAWHDAYDVTGDLAPPDGSVWEDGGTVRVMRGGSYKDGASLLRTSARLGASWDSRDDRYGFRCARDVQSFSGTVTRGMDLAPAGDGTGTLCVALLDRCPASQDMDVFEHWGTQVDNVDLSEANMSQSFELLVPWLFLHQQSYFIGAAFKENGNCADGFEKGDLISIDYGDYGDGGGASCAPVTVINSEPISGLHVELNGIIE